MRLLIFTFLVNIPNKTGNNIPANDTNTMFKSK